MGKAKPIQDNSHMDFTSLAYYYDVAIGDTFL